MYKKSFLNDDSIRFIETPKATYSDFSWMVKTYTKARRIVVCPSHLYFYNFENPDSSFRSENENCFYKPYHCNEAINILLTSGVFRSVSRFITPSIFRTCRGHARYIREDLREEYFKLYRDVLIKLQKNVENFSCLSSLERKMARLLLQDNCTDFYKQLQRSNKSERIRKALVKLSDKYFVFRVPHRIYLYIKKRIVLKLRNVIVAIYTVMFILIFLRVFGLL